jgi:hypothetical protein
MPSLITMCLPCRTTRNPTLCKVRTASWWLSEVSRHALRRDFDLTDHCAFQELVPRGQILQNRVLDLLDGLLLGGALRPTARQSGNRNAESFVGFP